MKLFSFLNANLDQLKNFFMVERNTAELLKYTDFPLRIERNGKETGTEALFQLRRIENGRDGSVGEKGKREAKWCMMDRKWNRCPFGGLMLWKSAIRRVVGRTSLNNDVR